MNTKLYANTNDWIISISTNIWVDSITVSATNLTLKSTPEGKRFQAFLSRWDNNLNTDFYFPNNNESFEITTNRITRISSSETEMGGTFVFTPVSYTNQLVGFRIVHNFTIYGGELYGFDEWLFGSNTWYVALSDTPVEVGEGDVERELDLSEPEEP